MQCCTLCICRAENARDEQISRVYDSWMRLNVKNKSCFLFVCLILQRLLIAKEFGDRAAERRAYCNLGNAYIFLGQFEAAAEHYKSVWFLFYFFVILCFFLFFIYILFQVFNIIYKARNTNKVTTAIEYFYFIYFW